MPVYSLSICSSLSLVMADEAGRLRKAGGRRQSRVFACKIPLPARLERDQRVKAKNDLEAKLRDDHWQ
jgi:hypothetical protein